MTDTSCVKVAVRIRPQLPIDNFDKRCVNVVPNEPQIYIGNKSNKSFTFDEVFDVNTTQETIYDHCVKDLVDGCFEGYNATVLAYGQTGSGKTYTMGTGFDVGLEEHQIGIVPRAIQHLFSEVERRKTASNVKKIQINAQFIELYNEELVDLLNSTGGGDKENRKVIKIHENHTGIYCFNLVAKCVENVHDAMDCLKIGSLCRTTASTNMNRNSSRSHAIFTILIKQERLSKVSSNAQNSCDSVHEDKYNLDDSEIITAKFHFVDLAGSERLKRTQATGERQREGISINSGLLALGNVISALGDKSRRVTHVPYRDSKLTRLLQDSLGGNSRTLMIACISPSDRDFLETLNTLTYANRAKKIKNKVTVNMDKTSQTISSLREQVENLKLELIEYKQGKRLIGEDGTECINDMYHENTMLQTENKSLKTRIKGLLETVDHLTVKNVNLIAEKEAGKWIQSNEDGSSVEPLQQMITGYIKEVETLRAKLLEVEEINHFLRTRQNQLPQRFSAPSSVAIAGQYDIRNESGICVNELINEAKENLKKLKKKKRKLKSSEKEISEKESEGTMLSDEDKDIDEKSEKYEDEKTEDGDVIIMPEDSSSDSEDQVDDSVELADLTCEISMKEKLIRQIEMQQYRMTNMQKRYEEKILQMKSAIDCIERERNHFLQNLDKEAESMQIDKVEKVNEDYDRRINFLKKNVRQMQVAKNQHVSMMKNDSRFKNELNKLRAELIEMKKTKATLLNKMKEQTKRHKECEYKTNKEITQLKKDQRNKETRIKALESEKIMKEAVLRRKQEELMALRKRNKNNALTNTRSHLTQANKNHTFSPRTAKLKWQNLEKRITKLVLNKKSIALIEKDMNFYLLEREKLSKCLENVEHRICRFPYDEKESEEFRNLELERNNLVTSLDYAHDQINDCQVNITQLDTVKNDIDAVELPNLFRNASSEELKYLIEKLLIVSINQSFQALQYEDEVKELKQNMQQIIDSNAVQEQLLLHLINRANLNIACMIRENNRYEESPEDDLVPQSYMDSPIGFQEQAFLMDHPRKKKARETAITANDILYAGNQEAASDYNMALTEYNILDNFPSNSSDAMISTKINESLNLSFSSTVSSPSSGYEYGDSYHITNQTECVAIGEMTPFTSSSSSPSTTYLKCTHTARGHKDGVICIECTNDVLFSGSKDCTVKIWDLTTGKIVQQLNGHPNAVKKIRYCEYSRLAFTVSLASIKIWDMRQKSACVYTLSSSGIAQKGASPNDMGFKQVVPPGEHEINDIALNQYGSFLYSAASSYVRIWDLNKFQSICSLSNGFQSIVTCIAVDDLQNSENRILTGADDRSVKYFEVKEAAVGIHHPKYFLSPPHYEPIQSVITHENTLFSASTDMCIKKWNLDTLSVEKSLTLGTRKDRLCSLNVIPSGSLFLIGYQSGHLGLWSSETFQCLEELRAHESSINAISSNKSSIFTASDDGVVGIWKLSAINNNFDFQSE